MAELTVEACEGSSPAQRPRARHPDRAQRAAARCGGAEGAVGRARGRRRDRAGRRGHEPTSPRASGTPRRGCRRRPTQIAGHALALEATAAQFGIDAVWCVKVETGDRRRRVARDRRRRAARRGDGRRVRGRRGRADRGRSTRSSRSRRRSCTPRPTRRRAERRRGRGRRRGRRGRGRRRGRRGRGSRPSRSRATGATACRRSSTRCRSRSSATPRSSTTTTGRASASRSSSPGPQLAGEESVDQRVLRAVAVGLPGRARRGVRAVPARRRDPRPPPSLGADVGRALRGAGDGVGPGPLPAVDRRAAARDPADRVGAVRHASTTR